MIFNARAVPFWEAQKGTGPVTQLQKKYDEAHNAAECRREWWRGQIEIVKRSNALFYRIQDQVEELQSQLDIA